MTHPIQLPNSTYPGHEALLQSAEINWLARFLLSVLLAICTPSWAEEALQGRVVGVAGGQVLTLLDTQHREHKIRLAYIDTPELPQTFGREAQTALASMVLNQEIKLQVLGKAADGSIQAEVIGPRGSSVNVELLRRGLAWHVNFEQQSTADQERYQAALLDAQRDRRGMWALDQLELPKDFRARRAQLLRWWLYAIAACAALLLYAGIFAVYGPRIEAWLAKQEDQEKSRSEHYRQARDASEAAAAERDRIREIADREMGRLAAERRQQQRSEK
jgi:endonuclease YncB( thermonuclease family)